MTGRAGRHEFSGSDYEPDCSVADLPSERPAGPSAGAGSGLRPVAHRRSYPSEPRGDCVEPGNSERKQPDNRHQHGKRPNYGTLNVGKREIEPAVHFHSKKELPLLPSENSGTNAASLQ